MEKKIAITIDEEVLNAIKKIAHDEDRTLSSQINKILKDKIKLPMLYIFLIIINILKF